MATRDAMMEQLFNAPPPRRRQHRAVAVNPFAAIFGDMAGQEASHNRVEAEPQPPAAGADSRGDQARQDVAERPPPRTVVRMKQCSGVADTPCEQQIPARLKRCPTCRVENRRRQRKGYNRDYSQKNREPINVKRDDRRRTARENARHSSRPRPNAAPTGRAETMPKRRSGRQTITDQERKILAEDLLIERYLNSRSPSESWQHVRPDSQAQPNSARTLYHRSVNWYADRFPVQCQKFVRRLRKKIEEQYQAWLSGLLPEKHTMTRY